MPRSPTRLQKWVNIMKQERLISLVYCAIGRKTILHETTMNPYIRIYFCFNLIISSYLILRNLNTTYLKLRFLKEKWTSTIPVVFTRVLRISCSVGWYSLAPNRSKSSRKLWETINSWKCGYIVLQDVILLYINDTIKYFDVQSILTINIDKFILGILF